MNKDYQQIAIETTDNRVVVNSAAASGKTYLITERVKWLIANGIPKERIVVITFTNNAAEEMKQRLGEYGNGIFINTIHSYVNYLLLCYGIDTSVLLKQEKFDDLFQLIKKNTYCIQPVEHLLLDEAQDSDELQIDFILNYVKPYNWFFVGDLRQAIYGFSGSDPKLMEHLMNRDDTTVFNLPFNHRNDRAILSYAQRILSKTDHEDDSIAVSNNYGQVIETEYSADTLLKYISATVKQGGKYGDWFVLGRSNAQVDEMFKVLSDNNIPCDTFKRAELTNAELAQKMKDNTVKVLTIHASKGLENEYVAVNGGLFYNDEERRVCYVAATRAKHLLLWFKRPKKVKINKKKSNIVEWE